MRTKPVILVTGASSGIGQALLAALVSEPVTILAHCNNHLVAFAGEKNPEAEVVALRADFEAEAAVNGLIDEIVQRYQYPDKIVLLTAPKLRLERFSAFSWDYFERDLRIQLRSAIRILAAFLPAMAQAKCRGKVVIMLSSVTLGVPPRNMTAYTVNKYAMLGLMRSLASEYAGSGLCINAVSPSMIETEFLSDLPSKLIEVTAAQSPLKRNAQPKDIVPAVCYLLSSQSEYVTGINLPVTGGGIF